jgi:hypothetical protein
VRNGRQILLTKHLYAHKVLLHAINLLRGTDGFNSPPKEVVLRIVITLKNPSTLAGIEPATLGPVASTLTEADVKTIKCTKDGYNCRRSLQGSTSQLYWKIFTV